MVYCIRTYVRALLFITNPRRGTGWLGSVFWWAFRVFRAYFSVLSVPALRRKTGHIQRLDQPKHSIFHVASKRPNISMFRSEPVGEVSEALPAWLRGLSIPSINEYIKVVPPLTYGLPIEAVKWPNVKYLRSAVTGNFPEFSIITSDLQI